VETHIVPLLLDAALGLRPPLQIKGCDYPTPDGTAVRDYVHVADLADAHVAALCHLCEGGRSVRLNLGTGTGHSVLEVVAVAEGVTGRVIPTVRSARRPGDPPALIARPGRASAELRLGVGWPVASMERIVASAWQWHLKRHQLNLLPRVLVAG
jgi:UDP-arabinose 4-epimerase